MRVTTLRIENFRGIKRLDLDLDLDKLMVLIGENNTGKTADRGCSTLCGCRLLDVGVRGVASRVLMVRWTRT